MIAKGVIENVPQMIGKGSEAAAIGFLDMLSVDASAMIHHFRSPDILFRNILMDREEIKTRFDITLDDARAYKMLMKELVTRWSKPTAARLAGKREFVSLWANLIFDPKTNLTGIVFGDLEIGKSSLSYYLLRREGFEVIDDDDVYVKLSKRKLVASANRDVDVSTFKLIRGPAKGRLLSLTGDQTLRSVDFVVYLEGTQDPDNSLRVFLDSHGFNSLEDEGDEAVTTYRQAIMRPSKNKKRSLINAILRLPRKIFLRPWSEIEKAEGKDKARFIQMANEISQWVKTLNKGARLAAGESRPGSVKGKKKTGVSKWELLDQLNKALETLPADVVR